MTVSEPQAPIPQPPPASAFDTPVSYAWNPWVRGAASLAVAWHLIGVMVAPISVSPQMNRGDSVIGAELKKVYGPYITATYLDHSYKFFAPNPGDSHLLRFDLYFADGSKRVNRDDQILPDRQGQWPRLLYHRHFMLTEFINLPDIWMLGELQAEEQQQRRAAGLMTAGPPNQSPARLAGELVGPLVPPGAGPPGDAQPGAGQPERPANIAFKSNVPLLTPAGDPRPIADLLEEIAREEQSRLEAAGGASGPTRPPSPVIEYWRAAAAYLARRHGATRIDLFYRKHILSSVDDYRRAGRLDPPESYRDQLLISYRVEGTK